MTQADPQNTDRRSPQSGPMRILWLIAGALVLGCVCSLGALLLLRQFSELDWIQNLRPLAVATATQRPPTSAASSATPGNSPTPSVSTTPTGAAETPRAAATPTATATATPIATATATQTATATHTATATRTPTPTLTPTTTGLPTPFVCDSIYELAGIRLAPGQTFQCTLQEQELTDLANRYPDSPCSQTRIRLDNGEIDVECRIGVRMNAVLAARTTNCRVEIEIVRGTVGFKRIVQELIVTQFDVIRYDTVCVNRVEIDDGQIIVAGYGR